MSELNPLIEELEHRTIKLVSNIQHANYEEIEDYTIVRESLVARIAGLSARLTSNDKSRINSICNYDHVITDRMLMLKKEAGDWLLKREAIKDQKTAYNTAYTLNSMFFDRKN